MARVTLKDLRKRMRSPEVQGPMLKAIRELEDNPRAMEIYIGLLSAQQMTKLAGLMRLGISNKSLERKVDLAAQSFEAQYGPKGTRWADLRMRERIGKEELASREKISMLGLRTQKETGLARLASQSSVQGLKLASGEKIAGMERAVAYPGAVIDFGKSLVDRKSRRDLLKVQQDQLKIYDDKLKGLNTAQTPRTPKRKPLPPLFSGVRV